MTPNLERLEACYQANVEADPKKFDMVRWESPCGTVHCLVGNYLAKHPDCGLELLRINKSVMLVGHGHRQMSAAAAHFGLSMTDAGHLFLPTIPTTIQTTCDSLPSRLARLRNFIDSHKPTVPTLDFKEPHCLADLRMLVDAF